MEVLFVTSYWPHSVCSVPNGAGKVGVGGTGIISMAEFA